MSNRIPLAASAAFAVLAAVAVSAPPAAATGPLAIAPGFDLFVTDAGVSSLGPTFMPLMHFRGVPVGIYDFGSGPVDTGAADTIVQRGGADADSPVAAIQLVKLQLQGVEDPSLFVTLQSDRGRNALDPPVGPPSLGVIQVQFDPNGLGGTFDSTLNVNFDVRSGDVTGPIVASASLVLSPTTTPFSHVRDQVRCMTHPEFLTNADVLARHGICDGPATTPAIPGVNVRLDGFSDQLDFHPGHPRLP
jgi:hypothetical protein